MISPKNCHMLLHDIMAKYIKKKEERIKNKKKIFVEEINIGK